MSKMKQTTLWNAPEPIRRPPVPFKFAPFFVLVGNERYRRTQKRSEGITISYPSDSIYNYLIVTLDKASIRVSHWEHSGSELSPSLLQHCLKELLELGLIEEVGVTECTDSQQTIVGRQTVSRQSLDGRQSAIRQSSDSR